MKVILNQDVARLGRKDQIVNVSDGYALNKLLPKKLAVLADSRNTKSINLKLALHEKGQQGREESLKQVIENLEGKKITVAVSANEKGGLFKAISEEEVAAAIAEKGESVSVAQIKIKEPIKELGEYEVGLLEGEVSGVLAVEVVKK